MAKKTVPQDSVKKFTNDGPHGGKTEYNQMAMGKGFVTHDGRPAETQKQNVVDPFVKDQKTTK